LGDQVMAEVQRIERAGEDDVPGWGELRKVAQHAVCIDEEREHYIGEIQ